MKIVVDASNIRHGGGVQVSISLLQEFIAKYEKLEIIAFLSHAVDKQLSKKFIIKEKYINNISSNLIIRGKKTRDHIRKRCKVGDVDLCFTVFGPSLLKVNIPHVMGFANPWLVLRDIAPYNLLGEKARFLAHLKYFFYKKSLNFFKGYVVVETDFIARGLVDLGIISENRVFVIGNTYSQSFAEYINSNKIESKKYVLNKIDGYTYFLCMAHDYIHKNISIIEPVNKILSDKKIKAKFITTIEGGSFKKKSINLKNACVNVGQVNIVDCPYIYQQVDALFLPTLLECFSASYPEAMIMKKPILTSDRVFSHEVCGDTAIYFDPLSPEDIANKIETFIKNKISITVEFENKAEVHLKSIETFATRSRKFIALFEKIILSEK